MEDGSAITHSGLSHYLTLNNIIKYNYVETLTCFGLKKAIIRRCSAGEEVLYSYKGHLLTNYAL
jgi:hypothetical protein